MTSQVCVSRALIAAAAETEDVSCVCVINKLVAAVAAGRRQKSTEHKRRRAYVSGSGASAGDVDRWARGAS